MIIAKFFNYLLLAFPWLICVFSQASMAMFPSFELAQIGAKNQEVQNLLQALEIVNKIEQPQNKSLALTEIALQFYEIGELEKAKEILHEALNIWKHIESPPEQVSVLGVISIAYNKIGDTEQASKILHQANLIINTIEDKAIKANLLVDLAIKYNQIGETEIAAELLNNAQEKQEEQETSVAEVKFPFEPQPWDVRIFLGGNLFTGSNNFFEFSTAVTLEKDWARNEYDLDLTFLYSYDTTRQQNQLSRIRGFVTTEYRHHFTPRWQYFFNISALRDEFDDIDIRTSFYTGPGINIWRRSKDESLDMQFGLGGRYENSNRRTNDFDLPTVTYGLRHKNIIFGQSKLRQFLTFEFPVEDLADYFIRFSTDLAIPLTARWDFSNRVLLRYSGKPTLDSPSLEAIWITGLEYNF